MSTTTRAAIVSYCKWGIQHEPEIHYAEVRPIPSNPRTLPMTTDCSGFATLAYKIAGAPDPNGNGYNGSGYTGTLLMRGRKVSAAREGDLVVFGPYPGHHVCIVMEPGADPLLCSHGQERGPIPIRLSEEQKHQPSPATFLSYLPDPPPKPKPLIPRYRVTVDGKLVCGRTMFPGRFLSAWSVAAHRPRHVQIDRL